jgi:hypothetical protein
MPPSTRSTIIEIFSPEGRCATKTYFSISDSFFPPGFLFDYEILARNLGHRVRLELFVNLSRSVHTLFAALYSLERHASYLPQRNLSQSEWMSSLPVNQSHISTQGIAYVEEFHGSEFDWLSFEASRTYPELLNFSYHPRLWSCCGTDNPRTALWACLMTRGIWLCTRSGWNSRCLLFANCPYCSMRLTDLLADVSV